MYSESERESYFQEVTSQIAAISNVEGIIQLGSGTLGYTDAYSDIDLMIATTEQFIDVKEKLITVVRDMGAFYVKEYKFSEEIRLIIPFFQNGLEMNISVLPVRLLTVKSPLWKIQFDRHGQVGEKMTEENTRFHTQVAPYLQPYDIGSEYAYLLRKVRIELRRGNHFYAMQMLEELREKVLTMQIIKEDKKLHQFKAYHTLDPIFLEELSKSYPSKIETLEIWKAADVLTQLFIVVLQNNKAFPFDEKVFQIAEIE
jgi:hypothetical protein